MAHHHASPGFLSPFHGIFNYVTRFLSCNNWNETWRYYTMWDIRQSGSTLCVRSLGAKCLVILLNLTDLLYIWGAFQKHLWALKIQELLKFQCCIKIVSFNIWVTYFVWNFKGYLSKFYTKYLTHTLKDYIYYYFLYLRAQKCFWTHPLRAKRQWKMNMRMKAWWYTDLAENENINVHAYIYVCICLYRCINDVHTCIHIFKHICRCLKFIPDFDLLVTKLF